jgi:outer membrane lipoprotein-sorting protein
MCIKFSLLTIFFVTAVCAGISGNQIVKRVDNIRNPSKSFQLKVNVVSSDDVDGPWKGDVMIKGNFRTLVKTLAPKRVRGQNLLMLNEDMWLYLPNLKRAVRVSLKQKLTGEAANGDIARMRWFGDYKVKIEDSNKKQWVLYLTAKKKGLTYDKIRAWVNKKNFHPIKAEFLSMSGKVLRRAKYKRFKSIAGRVRPTEIHIFDAVDKSKWSKIQIKKMIVKSFPISLFNKSSLK